MNKPTYIMKAFRYRIYPTKVQQVMLAKHFGCVRYVYNHFLAKYKEKEDYTSYQRMTQELTKLKKENNHLWLNEVSTQALQQSLKDLDEAYRYFFRKLANYPIFKRKNTIDSFRAIERVMINGNKLFLQRFREGIKINQHRALEGEIRHCTITRRPSGKYYVSIVCKVEHNPLFVKTNKCVGIDTGVEKLATLSNGIVYENINSLKGVSKRLDYLQRQLSKKKVGSCSFKKQKKQIAVLHEKVKNRRADYLHKTSKELVEKYDLIGIETLDLEDLYKTHSIARSLEDVAIGKFYEMLQYKAHWYGKEVIKIDQFFPSSKQCNVCGFTHENLKLNIRQWECPNCSILHDRDNNASINILREALRVNKQGCGTQSYKKQEEALSLDKSMNLEANI